MKSMTITGKGVLSLKPDTICLYMTVVNDAPSYEETIRVSTERTGELKETLVHLGFAREDVKTTGFRVNTRYESVQDERGNWRQEFQGYEARHELKLSFPVDNARLGIVLGAVANAAARPEFSIDYTVADPEAVKEELLAAAMQDARRKARAIAQAAGVRLKKIKSIQYAWGEIDLVSRPFSARLADQEMAPVMAKSSASFDVDIDPENIRVEDTVTVVWKIKSKKEKM